MTTPARQQTRPTIFDLVGAPGSQRVPKIYTATTPAPGAEWTLRIPPGVIWQVQVISAKFVTSATVQTRAPLLAIGDGTITLGSLPVGDTQPASSTFTYNWWRDYTDHYRETNTLVPVSAFPRVPLLGSWLLSSVTANIDATDQWSAITAYVIELWPAPDVDLTAYAGANAGPDL